MTGPYPPDFPVWFADQINEDEFYEETPDGRRRNPEVRALLLIGLAVAWHGDRVEELTAAVNRLRTPPAPPKPKRRFVIRRKPTG